MKAHVDTFIEKENLELKDMIIYVRIYCPKLKQILVLIFETITLKIWLR